MSTRSTLELDFVKPKQALSSVEVDLNSIPEEMCGYDDIIKVAMTTLAGNFPDDVTATIYTYEGASINFDQQQTWSVFIGVAGKKKKEILSAVLNAFKNIGAIKAKMSDAINPAKSVIRYHLQDGHAWYSEEEGTWRATEQEEPVGGGFG